MTVHDGGTIRRIDADGTVHDEPAVWAHLDNRGELEDGNKYWVYGPTIPEGRGAVWESAVGKFRAGIDDHGKHYFKDETVTHWSERSG